MKNGDEPIRVLVVEDSPTQARVLQGLLSRHGFDVETAVDGPAGYERFQNSQFDAVVSDVIMPGISGYELCKRIKQSPKGSSTAVILVTALNELKDLIDGLQSGADNFISKPVNPEYLVSRITAAVSDKSESTQTLCDPKTGVCFLDQSFIKTLDRKRILDYLVSTFDDFLRLREGQSQRKLAEAQRYFRLVKQQDTRARKVAAEIKDKLHRQQSELNNLIEHDGMDKKSAEAIAQIRRESQAIEKMVGEMADMFDELETVASEQS